MRSLKRRVWHFTVAQVVRVNETPVFVVGNQKSGTTAIAALLSEYADLSSLLDFRPTSSRQLVKLHENASDLEPFIQVHRPEFANDLIKEPRLTFFLPELRERFPHAQYIMVVRDPRSNIRSILDRLNLPGDARRVNVTKYPEVNPGWEPVLSNAGLNLPGSTYIERLAHRWRHAACLCQRYADVVHLVRYEDFCESKAETIASLAQCLDLSQQNDIADKVNEQYQPRGSNRDVSWQAFFGEENLVRIENICGNEMGKFGYKPLL